MAADQPIRLVGRRSWLKVSKPSPKWVNNSAARFFVHCDRSLDSSSASVELFHDLVFIRQARCTQPCG